MTKVAAAVDVDVGDGLQLHVVRSGSGPALLMLHGFTGSAATWAPLSEALGDRFATIAVDLPGHRASSAPADSARYALGRLAADLARVLDRLGVARAAVLGYSMGGRAALRFALEHPDRVTALVLESSSPGIADPAERASRRAADVALAEAIERDGVAAFVERWEALPLWATQRALPAAARDKLRAQRLANTPLGLSFHTHACRPHSWKVSLRVNGSPNNIGGVELRLCAVYGMMYSTATRRKRPFWSGS